MSFGDFLRKCAGAGAAGGISAAALARAIGVSPTRMSRALRGQVRGFKAETVLRLAAHCNLDPLETLREAGHAELAALLAAAFVVPHIPAGRARETVRQYLELDAERRRTVERLVADLARFDAELDDAEHAPAVPAETTTGAERASRRTRRPRAPRR